jgi:hypothetical protein
MVDYADCKLEPEALAYPPLNWPADPWLQGRPLTTPPQPLLPPSGAKRIATCASIPPTPLVRMERAIVRCSRRPLREPRWDRRRHDRRPWLHDRRRRLPCVKSFANPVEIDNATETVTNFCGKLFPNLKSKYDTPMKQITASKFKAAIKRDPAWASRLTEPVEIKDYCHMVGSDITHLSPFLHFTGRDGDGNAACFAYCRDLEVAEGEFDGGVYFDGSAIKKIGMLKITAPNNEGMAASFDGCKYLEVAEGTFPGGVSFNNSGIVRISALTISEPDNAGDAATFNECFNLKIAEGTFPGYVEFSGSGIEEIGDLLIDKPNNDGVAASLNYCKSLKLAKGTFPGYVEFNNSGIEKIGNLHIKAPDFEGRAANFSNCKGLKVAEGTFLGHVDFSGSGVNKTGKLAITRSKRKRIKADFTGCNVRLPKEFLGSEYEMDDEIRQKNLGRIAAGKAIKAAPAIEI